MGASTKAFAGTAICMVLAVSFLVLAGPNLGLLSYTDVPFEVIDFGEGYNYEQRANFTITNERVWESLWLGLYSGHIPIPEVPTINFTSEMLIAVFQGERGSSGYATNITRIIMTDAYYVVYVDETHPSEGCITLTVMTYPYQIVKISGYPFELPVRYVYNIIIHECE
ncbi:protease complex subunit PrcB family protein [Candidatus Thorarchaeota archaeon]|nr:MAG: protease complex subunit PrcB family protein [Candidatus Thorarchaeota archaeon]